MLNRPKREVFLCHSSRDKAYVRRLAIDLEVMGVSPWFDAWEMAVGDSLIERIGEGKNSAKLFCIILSKESARSNWCKADLSEVLANSINNGRENILVIKKGKMEAPPFLKHRVYINAPRYSLRLPLAVAFKAMGFSPKEIDLHVYQSRISNTAHALNILSQAARKNARDFGSRDWKELRTLFRKHDITFNDDDVIRISSLTQGKNFLAK